LICRGTTGVRRAPLQKAKQGRVAVQGAFKGRWDGSRHLHESVWQENFSDRSARVRGLRQDNKWRAWALRSRPSTAHRREYSSLDVVDLGQA